MFGALIWDCALLILGSELLFQLPATTSSTRSTHPSPAYAIPSGPFYQFLAALVFNTPILTVLLLGSFLFWSLPSMIANTYMPIRSFFAWSFDRLMPERLASVNERTHSPIPAILVANGIIAAVVIWSVYSSAFQLVLGLIVLAGALAVIIVAAAAIALPRRRPDLYQASPANVNCSACRCSTSSGRCRSSSSWCMIWISLKYPALVMSGDSSHIWWIPTFLASLIAIGLIIYYLPRYLRRRQGVNIDFVYKELPPE